MTRPNIHPASSEHATYRMQLASASEQLKHILATAQLAADFLHGAFPRVDDLDPLTRLEVVSCDHRIADIGRYAEESVDLLKMLREQAQSPLPANGHDAWVPPEHVHHSPDATAMMPSIDGATV